jgi:hypothetical protein
MASALYRGLSVASRRVATRPSTASLLLQQQERATAGNFLVRAWFASYPPHELVGMPSLSPVRLFLFLNHFLRFAFLHCFLIFFFVSSSIHICSTCVPLFAWWCCVLLDPFLQYTICHE